MAKMLTFMLYIFPQEKKKGKALGTVSYTHTADTLMIKA